MNKEEFLSALAALLSDMPEKDREDAIKYYSDYIDDAGEAAEQAIEELGSPDSVARMVKSESGDALEPKPVENPPMEQPGNLNAAYAEPVQGDNGKKRLPAWAIVVITVLSPVILAVALVILILVLCVVLAALGLVFAVTALFLLLVYVAGLSFASGGFMIFEGAVAAGLVTLGTGLFILAAGLIVLIAAGFGFVKFLPWLFRVLFSSKKKRLARKEAKRLRREAKNAEKDGAYRPEQTEEQPVPKTEQQEPATEQPEPAAEQPEPAPDSTEQGVE